MLVLSRKAGERIVIGDRITVVVSRINGGRVTLAIQAPEQVKIIRGELRPYTNAFCHREEAKAEVVVHLNGDTPGAEMTEVAPLDFTVPTARLPR
jgi:carbon storage regulator